MKRLAFIACWLWSLLAWGGEVIPPAPPRYFNDYAQVVPAQVASQLNAKLEDFERTSANQVLVAIYPKMDSDSSIDDYTVRVARAWKAGQKTRNNGVILFVFIQNRQMFIQVGYGLEGALPDALCKQITEYEIKPHFKSGDYAGGLAAGVDAIIAATKGEHKGTGATVASGQVRRSRDTSKTVLILVFAAFVLMRMMFSRSSHGWLISSVGWGLLNSGRGGGGGFSSGGGGFSGGGGEFRRRRRRFKLVI